MNVKETVGKRQMKKKVKADASLVYLSREEDLRLELVHKLFRLSLQ